MHSKTEIQFLTKTTSKTQDRMCESFLGTLEFLRIFRDNWSLKPSIHIHGDLHAHTEFAVDVMAGSEPEGLYSTVQPPCCWVECRFHSLTLMFTVVQEKRGCFRDSRGWAHRVNASIKTRCGTQSREKSMGAGFPASAIKTLKRIWRA